MVGYGFLIARLCLAAVFLYSGVDKLGHWQSSIDEVKGDGLPWPAVFANATIFTQLVGGCLVATDWLAWLGALLLSGFTVAATLLGHRFWLRRGAEFRHEVTTRLAWSMWRSSAGCCCSASWIFRPAYERPEKIYDTGARNP